MSCRLLLLFCLDIDFTQQKCKCKFSIQEIFVGIFFVCKILTNILTLIYNHSYLNIQNEFVAATKFKEFLLSCISFNVLVR